MLWKCVCVLIKVNKTARMYLISMLNMLRCKVVQLMTYFVVPEIKNFIGLILQEKGFSFSCSSSFFFFIWFAASVFVSLCVCEFVARVAHEAYMLLT